MQSSIQQVHDDSPTQGEAGSRVVGVLTIEDIIEELLQTEVPHRHPCSVVLLCPCKVVPHTLHGTDTVCHKLGPLQSVCLVSDHSQ